MSKRIWEIFIQEGLSFGSGGGRAASYLSKNLISRELFFDLGAGLSVVGFEGRCFLEVGSH